METKQLLKELLNERDRREHARQIDPQQPLPLDMPIDGGKALSGVRSMANSATGDQKYKHWKR